jgi:gamma-glutamyltranspeptidase / glutathione hydrolase
VTTELRGRRVVASGHPAAATAGLGILDDGGSAVDAALAMAFTQWVVSGPTCGPGGDLAVMHVKGRRTRPEVTVYGGWSRAPLGVRAADLTSKGPLGAVVPGSLAGADAAWRAAGRVAWSRLFTEAVHLADGHEVTPWMARSYASVERVGNTSALKAVLGVDRPPSSGDTVSCPRLGASLALIADEGIGAFYEGRIADQIVSAAARDGGLITYADLAAVAADIARPAVREIDGLHVSVLPAPSQASITLDILAAASPRVFPESASFAASVAEVTKRGLIERCIVGIPGTAVSIAADDDEAAVVIHSLAGVQFGTGWVAGDTGIALGNRVGTALSARPDLPASLPVPGGVLPHTLSAALFDDGERWLLISTPGGDRQVQWLAQAGQRFRLGRERCSDSEIVTGPRWFVCPEGDRFGVPAGVDADWFMFAEPGVEWRDGERMADFAVRPVDDVGGGLQGVMWDGDAGWVALSDPRGGGSAGATVGKGS